MNYEERIYATMMVVKNKHPEAFDLSVGSNGIVTGVWFELPGEMHSIFMPLVTVNREKSELNCRDRYEVAENIYTEPISKKRLLNLAIIFIAMMVIGIPLILYLSELIFGF